MEAMEATTLTKPVRKGCKVEGCSVTLCAENRTGYCSLHNRSVGARERAALARANGNGHAETNGNGHAHSIVLVLDNSGAAEQRVNTVLLGLPFRDRLQLMTAYLAGK